MAAAPSRAHSSNLRTRDRGKRPQEEARLPILLVKKSRVDPSADGVRVTDFVRKDATEGSAGAEEGSSQLFTLHLILGNSDVPV